MPEGVGRGILAEKKTPVTITKRGRPVAHACAVHGEHKGREESFRAAFSRSAGSVGTVPARCGDARFRLYTHAWAWWVTGRSPAVAKRGHIIREAVRGTRVCLSMISVWEITKKVERQKEHPLDRPVREWIDQALKAVPGLSLLELTPAILMDSCELPQPFHGY